MKKRKILGMISVVCAVMLLLSGCGVGEIAHFLFMGLTDRVSPSDSPVFIEPDSVDYHVYRMFYEGMNEAQKQAYRIVYNSIFDHPEKILLPKLSQEELTEVMVALRWENPQILCLDTNYTYYTTNHCCYLMPDYAESVEQCRAHTEEMLETAAGVIDLLADTPDLYTRELMIHDAICDCCTYTDGAYAGNAYGALIRGNAVCSGYTAAAKLLFDMAGIRSAVISGTAMEDGMAEGHIWNAVCLSDEWYYTDVTWDDPVSEGNTENISHAYFNISEAELAVTHADFEVPQNISVTGGVSNYFIKSGLYCREDDWQSILCRVLADEVDDGNGSFELKFSTGELLQTVKKALFTGGVLQELMQPYLTGEGILCTYNSNDDVHVLHIHLGL